MLLFSPDNNLYLHRRAESKSWEPGKIDLASVAGQRRALIKENQFKNEEIRQTAIREISGETGIERRKLDVEKLEKLDSVFYKITPERIKLFDEPRFGTETWINVKIE